MATTAMDYENSGGDRFDDEAPRYERDNRSASPRSDIGGNDSARRRSASPGADRAPIKEETRDRRDDRGGDRGGDRDDDGAVNPGSNLFVTGIHPRLTEDEVSRLFTKYGTVEKCQIMRDPHTKESRGFGFVKMVTSDEADAAKEGLQGKEFEGRTLSIEKARRARPRTPTPGKYFGPPKETRGRFEGGGDRYGGDRRRGGYGGGGGYGGPRGGDQYRSRYRERDDRYGGGPRGGDRGGDRGYDDYDRGYEGGSRSYGGGGGGGGGYRDDRGGGYDRRGGGGGGRDDFERGGIDRYASGGRDDRYSGSRGGGSSGGFDRGYDRGADRAPRGGADPPADTYGGGGMHDSYPPRYGRD